jgi:hypothetical protein
MAKEEEQWQQPYLALPRRDVHKRLGTSGSNLNDKRGGNNGSSLTSPSLDVMCTMAVSTFWLFSVRLSACIAIASAAEPCSGREGIRGWKTALSGATCSLPMAGGMLHKPKNRHREQEAATTRQRDRRHPEGGTAGTCQAPRGLKKRGEPHREQGAQARSQRSADAPAPAPAARPGSERRTRRPRAGSTPRHRPPQRRRGPPQTPPQRRVDPEGPGAGTRGRNRG